MGILKNQRDPTHKQSKFQKEKIGERTLAKQLCKKKMSKTEGHKFSGQKGLVKWMNGAPYQEPCT